VYFLFSEIFYLSRPSIKKNVLLTFCIGVLFGIFFAYTTVSITECHFKDIKILPSKFSYETKKYSDHHSHGHGNYNEGLFNDSIIMKDHGVNETLHFRKSS
jgi:hypothetical protein